MRKYINKDYAVDVDPVARASLHCWCKLLA